MVNRLGTGVAPGGTLFLVGHLPVDPMTGAPTPATGQVQVSVDAAVDALYPREWQIVLAEERTRAAAGTGVDALIRAVHRTKWGLRSRGLRPSGTAALRAAPRSPGHDPRELPT